MRIIKIFIPLIIILVTTLTSCIQDDFEISDVGIPQNESGSIISFTTVRNDGIISLSVDAPVKDRSGIWIDLNNDGIRTEDGSENIKNFNVYQDYHISTGVNKISIHGDCSYLGAASNELTAIDVSNNPFLKTLNIPLNRLVSLELSKNIALINLDCSENSLISLNLSQNKSLESLWVFNNQLCALNVTNNIDLTFLDCSGNQLIALDITKNSELIHLLCYNNQLRSLDISHNNKLNQLWTFNNSLSANETEFIITSLQKVLQGDLWISNKPINNEQIKILTDKGWEVN